MKLILTTILLFVFGLGLNAQAKAFPTAQGGGSQVTGGRNGTVVHVTNLNSDGAGSLRAALLLTYARTIVFDVSGTITLTGSRINLDETHSNFTVAGQTAPQGGITVSGFPILLKNTDNFMFRYIRFRVAKYTGTADVFEHNGIIIEGADGYMFDHCSFAFNDDQGLTASAKWGDLLNGTVQRSLFSENATGAISGLENAGFTTNNQTWALNLWAHINNRVPNIGVGKHDIINNIMFNWHYRAININVGSPNVNFIGNYMREGSFTNNVISNVVQSPATPVIYSAFNYHNDLYPTTTSNSQQLMWTNFSGNGALAGSYFTTTQHTLLPNTTVQSATDAYNNVLTDVGANRYLDVNGAVQTYIDSYDTTRINDVATSTSRDPENKTWVLPTLPSSTRAGSFDTDGDGMADVWETATFGNLTKTAIGNDLDANYDNLEMYMNQVDTVVQQGIGSIKKKEDNFGFIN